MASKRGHRTNQQQDFLPCRTHQVREKKRHKIEFRYDLALFQTINDAGKGEPKQTKLTTFRFGSDIKLDVSRATRLTMSMF